MSGAIPGLSEKCKGAMLATAIGDALGWPNEPRSKNRIKKPKIQDCFVEWTRSTSNPRWHDEIIMPGEYSDDTQLTLSVARSILTDDWEKFLAEKELPFWLNYERGGGGALLKAAKSCKKGLLLWHSQYIQAYLNAGGNGAVMRILPHVIVAAKSSGSTGLMRDVIKDTLITHGHPRAFLGATCYAYALEYLLRKDTVLEYGELVRAVIDGQAEWAAYPDHDIFGQWLSAVERYHEYDFAAVWENTRVNMLQKLEFIRVSLKKGLILDDTRVLNELECFGQANGAGDVAALAAIYLASRYANNPTLGIKIPAFAFGADTDTVASITGGLLGMLSGTGWIPMEWKVVQDYECLIRVVDLLLAANGKEATKKEVKRVLEQNSQWKDTPIGKMRLLKSVSAPNGKNGVVIIEKWKTALGQTLYTKAYQMNEASLKPPMFGQQGKRNVVYNDMVPKVSVVREEWPQAAEDERQIISKLGKQGQFILNSEAIAELLDNPQFKRNITVRKTLNIISNLIEGKKTKESIAKQFEVELGFVEQLAQHVL